MPINSDRELIIKTPDSPPLAWSAMGLLALAVGVIGGCGVPEVMDAISYNEGRIRPVVAVVKLIASALSIGSGGAMSCPRVFRHGLWARTANRTL